MSSPAGYFLHPAISSMFHLTHRPDINLHRQQINLSGDLLLGGWAPRTGRNVSGEWKIHPFEDVFPIENGGFFSNVMLVLLVFRGVSGEWITPIYKP